MYGKGVYVFFGVWNRYLGLLVYIFLVLLKVLGNEILERGVIIRIRRVGVFEVLDKFRFVWVFVRSWKGF